MTLGQVFDPRRNALNAWRLLLAAEVMLWHCWPITNRLPPAATLQLLFSVGVDGFFAISGFLITRSWLDDPRLRDFLAARALRILPGYYVCLIVTAFAVAPLSVAIQGGSVGALLSSGAPLEYLAKNSAVAYVHLNIGATPGGVPHPGVWNGSLWSLVWEVACYLAVAAIGVAGLADRRWMSVAVLALAVVGAALVPPLTYPGQWTVAQLAVRSAIMFAAGAVVYQWKDVIPARWSLVAVCVVVVAAASRLPLRDHRVRRPAAQPPAAAGHRPVLRRLHLRVSGPAAAGGVRARPAAGGGVLPDRPGRHPAAGRGQLVVDRKAVDGAQTPAAPEVVCGHHRRTRTSGNHSSTVSTSAATLIAAYGAGSQPRSAKPNSPTVRDAANAASEPPATAAPAQLSQPGPPAQISSATANDTLACTRNATPMPGMCW